MKGTWAGTVVSEVPVIALVYRPNLEPLEVAVLVDKERPVTAARMETPLVDLVERSEKNRS